MTMQERVTPTRLNAWITARPGKAVRLLLVWHNVDQPQDVASWTPDELTRGGGEIVMDAVQEHCDGQQQAGRYAAVWVDSKDRALATKPIRCKPQEDTAADFETPVGAVKVEDPNSSGLTAQLMRHVETRERMNNAAMGGILKAYSDTLAEIRRENRELREENAKLRRKVQHEVHDDVAAAAALEEANERREIWAEVKDLGKTALHIVAAKHGVNVNGNGEAG